MHIAHRHHRLGSSSSQAMAAQDSSSGDTRLRSALTVSADDRARLHALLQDSPSPAPAPAAANNTSQHHVASFFEGLALRGIRVLSIQPGLIRCSYTVPNHLTDAATGCLAAGAVVSLVDEVGSAAAIADAQNLKVSVDMSVAFADLSQARPGDKLCIVARALGHKGAYSGTHVLFTNAGNGRVVAEGRHSLFGNMKKKTTTPAPAPAAHTRSNM